MLSTSMRFSPWYPIDSLMRPYQEELQVITGDCEQASQQWERVIPSNGPTYNYVIQAKTLQLRRYPSGQSAMIWYGVGAFPAVLAELVVLVPEGTLIRWLDHPYPESKLVELCARFKRRFGALPFLCS